MTPFTATIRNTEGKVIQEIEVEIEAEVDEASGWPDIYAVWLDDVNLLTSADWKLVAFGQWIAEQAERDESFVERHLDREGYVYRGLGGNDPDGHWSVRA